LAGAPIGCSLQTPTQARCQQNDHCRVAFGPGAVCDADGTCRFSRANPQCRSAYPDDLLSASESYAGWEVIGGFFDLSQPDQVALANGLELAVRTYGEVRHSTDLEIGAVICETGGKEQVAAEVAAYLTGELDAAVVVGGVGDQEVMAAFESTAPAGALLISPAATTTELWSIDTMTPSNAVPGVLWRTVPPDATQAMALVVDLLSPGVGRGVPVGDLAILYEQTSFGSGLAHEVDLLMQANGVTPTLQGFDPEDQDSMAAAVATLAELAALDEILLVAHDVVDLESFAEQWADKMQDRSLLLPSALAHTDAILAIPEPMRDQVRGVRLQRSSTIAYDAFADAFVSAYGGQAAADDLFQGSLAYDAGWLAIYGLAWAHLQGRDTTGERAAEGLRHTVAGTDLQLGPTSWSSLKERFEAGLPVNVEGASGALEYDLATEELRGRFEIWQVGVCADACAARLYEWPW
jgi:branched-chain amino acid transport system substrate-binding protein